MKRYYLSDLIGNGTEESPFRAAVADLGVNHVAVFPPQDMTTGQYMGSHCLVLVNAVNHAKLLADKRNDPMPDFPLDGKLSALRAATQQDMNAMLQRRGFSSGFATSAGYRDVIRGVGQQLDPKFSEDAFDVTE